jgi:F420H(2)-dependent quinone reductase
MARRLPRVVNLAIGDVVVNHRFAGFHRLLLRRTGGRVGAGALGIDVILVTTHGRRSGEHRTVPLGAVRDGAAWVITASNAGHDQIPAWALNLRADGAVTVERNGVAAPFVAHEAVGPEADRLWPIVIDAYPGYGDYRKRTDRPIPLFVLEPA